MSYADGLLSSGERIVYRTKQHPFVFIWGARYAILAIVIVLVLWSGCGVAADGPTGGLDRAGLGHASSSSSVASPSSPGPRMRYINQEYVLTNRRVIQVEGVLNRTATDSSLEKINDAVLTQSIFGRMFGFGDLDRPDRGRERHRARCTCSASPIAFKKTMLDAKHDYEVDMERVGLGAARRRSRRSGDAGPAPAGARAPTPARGGDAGCRPLPARRAAPAPPAREPTRDEVTRTLASLADLRDRGAISAEEYEAQEGGPARPAVGSPRPGRRRARCRAAIRGPGTTDGADLGPPDPRPNVLIRRSSSSPSCCSSASRSTSSATPSRPIDWATARRSCSGRLTLNPVAHFDPVGGTLLALTFIGSAATGALRLRLGQADAGQPDEPRGRATRRGDRRRRRAALELRAGRDRARSRFAIILANRRAGCPDARSAHTSCTCSSRSTSC